MNKAVKKLGSIGWKLVWAPVAHFISSGLVGLLVYWLTSTILLPYLFGLTGNPPSAMGAFSIHQFSLLLAVSSAVAVHIWEDYTLDIF